MLNFKFFAILALSGFNWTNLNSNVYPDSSNDRRYGGTSSATYECQNKDLCGDSYGKRRVSERSVDCLYFDEFTAKKELKLDDVRHFGDYVPWVKISETKFDIVSCER